MHRHVNINGKSAQFERIKSAHIEASSISVETINGALAGSGSSATAASSRVVKVQDNAYIDANDNGGYLVHGAMDEAVEYELTEDVKESLPIGFKTTLIFEDTFATARIFGTHMNVAIHNYDADGAILPMYTASFDGDFTVTAQSAFLPASLITVEKVQADNEIIGTKWLVTGNAYGGTARVVET